MVATSVVFVIVKCHLPTHLSLNKNIYRLWHDETVIKNAKLCDKNFVRYVMDNAVGCYAYGNMFWCM